MTGKPTSSSPGQLLLLLWSLLTFSATFLLVCSGGLVTSHGAGMAVPDWPNTYGYNMFLFPISRWVGGIFYEHSHRLIASVVGLMTMILAAWLLAVERRKWVKNLGMASFVAVCVQGLLGGLRVTENMPELGIFHGLLAQSFFCALGVLTLAQTASFLQGKWDLLAPDSMLRKLVMGITVLIFIQLGIAATMRHEHAGLSIPDFPLAYGKLLPDTSEQAVSAINASRVAADKVPTTAFQIWLQMAHRLVAVLIFVGVSAAAWRASATAQQRPIRLWCHVWLAMILVQIGLGAWTIWSNKAADVATTHVAVGALTLLLGVILSFRLCRGAQIWRFRSPQPSSPAEFISQTA